MGSRQNGSNEKGTPATVLVQTSETLAGLLQEVRTATPEELPVLAAEAKTCFDVIRRLCAEPIFSEQVEATFNLLSLTGELQAETARLFALRLAELSGTADAAGQTRH